MTKLQSILSPLAFVCQMQIILYVRKSDEGIMVITIYVDDLIVGGDNEKEVEHVKNLLKQKFDMKDLGELKFFLGIEVIKMPEGIWLLQR
jgi:hypothetical protein